MDEIAVSICCMTYNQEEYIAQTIEGFLNQTIINNCEIIIHDDASTDNTLKIIREYEKKYPSIIRVIAEEHNQYQLQKRPILPIVFKYVKGKYIALCEGDDCWLDNKKLFIQKKFLDENPEYSMCVHSSQLYDCNKSTVIGVQRCYRRSRDMPINHIITRGGGAVATASIFFRREYIENMPEFFLKTQIQDYPLELILASKGKVYYFNRAMSLYRMHTKTSVWDKCVENKERYISTMKQQSEMLQEFSMYTNGVYAKTIKQKNDYYNYRILVMQKKYISILKTTCSKYIIVIPIKKILKFMFRTDF